MIIHQWIAWVFYDSDRRPSIYLNTDNQGRAHTAFMTKQNTENTDEKLALDKLLKYQANTIKTCE